MRVKDGNSYVLVGSQGGAPTDPVWVHNLRINPDVEILDETVVAACPPYAEYQERTVRRIPVFLAERS